MYFETFPVLDINNMFPRTIIWVVVSSKPNFSAILLWPSSEITIFSTSNWQRSGINFEQWVTYYGGNLYKMIRNTFRNVRGAFLTPKPEETSINTCSLMRISSMACTFFRTECFGLLSVGSPKQLIYTANILHEDM